MTGARDWLGGHRSITLLMPNTLTLSRVLVTPLLFNELQAGGSGLLLYAFACASDVIDGVIARRLGAETRVGSMFDACADFLLLFTVSFQFYSRGLVSPLLLALMVIAFTQHIFTGPRPGADPLGKHIGTVLFLAFGVALICPTWWVVGWVSLQASGYIVASLAVKWIKQSSRLG